MSSEDLEHKIQEEFHFSKVLQQFREEQSQLKIQQLYHDKWLYFWIGILIGLLICTVSIIICINLPL